MPIYAGDPDVELERASSIAEGGHANVSKVSMGVHTGTHVDAPVHFLEGAPGMESVSLDALCGPAVVVDGTSLEGDAIGEADLLQLRVPEDRMPEDRAFQDGAAQVGRKQVDGSHA